MARERRHSRAIQYDVRLDQWEQTEMEDLMWSPYLEIDWGHGNAKERLEDFLRDLVVNCEKKIHLYMCGHDHCKNIIKTTLPKNKTVHNLVVGTGGKKYNESLVFLKNLKDNSDLIFHSPNLGFCYL